MFAVLSPSSLAAEDEDAKEQQTQFRASELSVVLMDSMSGERESRGGERERETESAREKKGVECSERAGPGNGLRPGQRKRPYCKV